MGDIKKWFYVFFIQVYNAKNAFCQSDFIVSSSSNLKVYWNIPTFQCRSFKLNFTEVAEKYGIIQNVNDDFRGSKIVILYDPGYFPAILSENGSTVLRNGGIPQDGNIQTHLKLIRDAVDDLIPDENFSGLGIIDFESWRPIFRQNFGSLSAYKNLSLEREQRLHPFWPKGFIEREAVRRFELYGRVFMEETLTLVQKLRPNANWGYYAYPYCFNKSPSYRRRDCPKEVQDENDRLDWLFSESNIFLPSLYFSEKFSLKDKMELIQGRINEAHRIIDNLMRRNINPSIVPYFYYKYQDTRKFLSKADLKGAFSVLSTLRIDGLVIWGSSNDVNSKSKCLSLYNYMNDILGPILINTT